ncbi:MAG: hypothetical protein A2166_02655 [Omnitrophica WOR_2 bacterium RBG_13_41_10]|nr:MAG: hypothetical protein A2166_02655 [Omnitrophica WOR_2 bacterium RBG_13_41_10]
MKNNKNILIISFVIILIVSLLGYFYNIVTIRFPHDVLQQIQRRVYLKTGNAEFNLDLKKDSYLMRIKHVINDAYLKDILVNGIKVTPNMPPYVLKRGIIETTYIYLPKTLIQNGVNTINISFLSNIYPADVDFRLYNYRKIINDSIFILFSDSIYLNHNTFHSGKILFSIIFISTLFLIVSFILQEFLSLNMRLLFLCQIYSAAPFVLILIIFYTLSLKYPQYKILVTPIYFLSWGLLTFIISQACIILRKIIKGYQNDNTVFIPFLENLIIKGPHTDNAFFLHFLLRQFILNSLKWLKKKEISDKLLITFMALLILSAFIFMIGSVLAAERIASVAFFILMISVAIKFKKIMENIHQE